MDWQTITALIIVFASAANLVRIATKGIRGKSSGGGCHSGCGSCPSSKQKPVQIEL